MVGADILDIKTLQAVTLVMVVLCSAVLFLLRKLHPGVPGLQYWAALALPVAVLAAALLVRGEGRPPLWNLVVSNLAIMGVPALLWAGARAYVAKPVMWVRAVVPVVGLAVGSIVALELSDAPLWTRFVVQGVFAGGLYLVTGMAMMARGIVRRPALYFFMGVISLHGLFLMLGRPIIVQGRFAATGSYEVPAVVILESLVFFLLIFANVVVLAMEHVNARLRLMAEHDDLTGVFNRGTFLALLDKARARAMRHQEPLAVMALDLDHFKRINDQFGHQGGDAVLRAFTSRVLDNLRDQDVLGRIGGEEFAVFMPATPPSQAQAVAERLRQVCEPNVSYRDQSVPFTVSVGVTMWRSAETADAVMNRADQALYQAKAQGRNRVVPKWPVEDPALLGPAASGRSPADAVA